VGPCRLDPTDEPKRSSGRAHAVDALDEAAAVRRDRFLAELDDSAAYQSASSMLAELVRRANARRKLDPHVASVFRVVAESVGVSAEALRDAVEAASLGEDRA
jgi:hypothetical protein